MYNVHTLTTGGYIFLLVGGDAPDLATIFDIYCDHCTNIMCEVLTQYSLAIWNY